PGLRVSQVNLRLPPGAGFRSHARDERRELDGIRSDRREHAGRRIVGSFQEVPGALGDGFLAKQGFRPAIEQDEVPAYVGDDNGMTDVFDYQIQAIALTPGIGLRLLKLIKVPNQLLIGEAQVGDITEYRDKSDDLAQFVEGGC